MLIPVGNVVMLLAKEDIGRHHRTGYVQAKQAALYNFVHVLYFLNMELF